MVGGADKAAGRLAHVRAADCSSSGQEAFVLNEAQHLEHLEPRYGQHFWIAEPGRSGAREFERATEETV